MCIVEAASASNKLKKVDSTDAKFEDFLTAGVRTAQVVDAGARVASDVAGTVLTLCRSGSDDRDDQCGVSQSGSDAARLIGQSGGLSGPACERIEYKCPWSSVHEVGTPCAECNFGKPETKSSTPPERKPKRGRPKKETHASRSNQCPEAAKRQVLEAV